MLRTCLLPGPGTINHQMLPIIRQATPEDAQDVIGILQEAAHWLEQSGKTMWRDDELSPKRGLFRSKSCS
jgi:hypothetical protein